MNEVASPVPLRFGPYAVIEQIGQGGSATVYRARHTTNGTMVAIKVGPDFLQLDRSQAERFEREFTAIQGLDHPNLVRALALGHENGVPYIVMEFVPGLNLEALIKQKGKLTPQEAVDIFLQVTEGLQYLHRNHFLHRDIKPSNIFVTREGQPKLGDFGLLKDQSSDKPLTRSRQSMGTIEYGAPEQFEDAKNVTECCDIYSLAATLYTALTGRFPFGNGGNLQILQRKFLHQFVPLRLLLPEVDPALDDVVTRSLQPNPAHRPSKCDDLLDVLRAYRPRLEGTDPVDLAATGVKVGANRRAKVRFAVDLSASFVPFHQNMRGRWEATILDISRQGLRLRTPRPVAVQSVLQVTVGGGTQPSLALVRWVKPDEDGTQTVGCYFVKELSSREFASFISSAVPQTSTN